MESSSEERMTHAWKSVYYFHVDEAAKWMNTTENNISDADVFSYLIWRCANMEGVNLDVTVGLRAIPFFFSPMARALHTQCLETDEMIGKDLNNPLMRNRYSCIVRIDLKKMCEQNEAKLYFVESPSTFSEELPKSWRPISLDGVREKYCLPLWKDFTPGERITNTVSYGYIVTPTGFIPMDCIKPLPANAIVDVNL